MGCEQPCNPIGVAPHLQQCTRVFYYGDSVYVQKSPCPRRLWQPGERSLKFCTVFKAPRAEGVISVICPMRHSFEAARCRHVPLTVFCTWVDRLPNVSIEQ